MPMIPFVERFPEVGARQTRFVTVTNRQELPDGEYGFFELYCNERGCDCRRVTILVLRPETGWSKVWATISYGWESVDFYGKWLGATDDAANVKGPCLDTFNAQTRYSAALLDLFALLIESPEYVERLERHYRMFRESVEQGPGHESDRSRTEARRKHVRLPGRRRRQRY